MKIHSDSCRISKMEHFILRTLCNYNKYKRPIYSIKIKSNTFLNLKPYLNSIKDAGLNGHTMNGV